MNHAVNHLGYLYAAYIVVWVVHSGYVWSLIRRDRRLRREFEELKRR